MNLFKTHFNNNVILKFWLIQEKLYDTNNFRKTIFCARSIFRLLRVSRLETAAGRCWAKLRPSLLAAVRWDRVSELRIIRPHRASPPRQDPHNRVFVLTGGFAPPAAPRWADTLASRTTWPSHAKRADLTCVYTLRCSAPHPFFVFVLFPIFISIISYNLCFWLLTSWLSIWSLLEFMTFNWHNLYHSEECVVFHGQSTRLSWYILGGYVNGYPINTYNWEFNFLINLGLFPTRCF